MLSTHHCITALQTPKHFTSQSSYSRLVSLESHEHVGYWLAAHQASLIARRRRRPGSWPFHLRVPRSENFATLAGGNLATWEGLGRAATMTGVWGSKPVNLQGFRGQTPVIVTTFKGFAKGPAGGQRWHFKTPRFNPKRVPPDQRVILSPPFWTSVIGWALSLARVFFQSND